jgi:hypothetical protein
MESGIRAAGGVAQLWQLLSAISLASTLLLSRGPALAALATLPLTCTFLHPRPRENLYAPSFRPPRCGLGPTNNGHRGRNACSHPLQKGISTSSRAGSVWHTTARLPSCVGSQYLSPGKRHGALPHVPHCTGLGELSPPPDLLCVRGSCGRPHASVAGAWGVGIVLESSLLP